MNEQQHPPEDINDGDIFDPNNIPDPAHFQDFLNNMMNMQLDPNIPPPVVPQPGGDANFFLTPQAVIDYEVNRILEHVYKEKSEREYIRDVLVNRDNSTWISFCMGQHSRLGKDSPLRVLPNDVYSIIRKFHRKDIQSMITDDVVEDILLIVDQVGCSVTTAIDSYLINDRDIVNAIMFLTI